MILVKLKDIKNILTIALSISLASISISYANNPYALYISSAKEDFSSQDVQSNNNYQGQNESDTQKVCDDLIKGKEDFITEMSINSDNKNSITLAKTQTKEQLLDQQKLLQKQISDCVSS